MAAEVPERSVLGAVALGTALIPLNSTMIAVALPGIAADLPGTVEDASWLVSAYLIAMASLQPLTGKIGDRLGRRPVVLGGLVGFGLASLAAAAAPSIGLLTVFRVLQAVAGAVVFPNAVALLREVLPAERRGAGFGMLGAVAGLSAAAGLPLGGLLVGLADWRWIFLVNLPLVAGALVLGWSAIAARARSAVGEPFDLAGAGLLAAILVGLSALVSSLDTVSAGLALGGAALLAAAGVAFVRLELGRADPVLEPRFFGRRSFSAATGAVALSNLAMYATLLAVPVAFSDGPGWSAEKVGLVLVPFSLALVVSSPLGGRVSDRVGRRAPAVGGFVLFGLSLIPLALAGTSIAALPLALTLIPAGVGMGFANPAIQTAAVEALEARHAGVASGVFSTGRYLGSIMAAGTLALAASSGPGSVEDLFWFAALTALASAFVAAGVASRPRSEAVG